jgi:hypothetical protein
MWIVALLIVIGAGVGVQAAAGAGRGAGQEGTVVGMLALNGGPPGPQGGQACGGGGPSRPLYHLCLQPGTITFTSSGRRWTVHTATGRFRIVLPVGVYRATSPCEGATVVVAAAATSRVDLWCQIS